MVCACRDKTRRCRRNKSRLGGVESGQKR